MAPLFLLSAESAGRGGIELAALPTPVSTGSAFALRLSPGYGETPPSRKGAEAGQVPRVSLNPNAANARALQSFGDTPGGRLGLYLSFTR